ncbi:helix-turn-helix domain-containing protein [Kitasatospora griseola]|uniref:helix-turn-helix domain-containing protein n=1 Tax=Kitasatospora griseola TaxID=2064 RepID=UPI00380552A1
MGRHEKAVVASTRQLAELALWLRAQRQDRGLTYAAMAKKSDYTATAFSRAASGSTVPTRKLTEAYAAICGADLRTARRLWRSARWADHRSRQEAAREALGGDIAAKWYDVLATQPRLISDYVALRRAMIGLRARGGQPSLAELQRLAGRADNGGWRLPASSLGAILRSETVPDLRHLIAFVHAVGDGKREAEWAAAWRRAERGDSLPTAWSWYQMTGVPSFDPAPAKPVIQIRILSDTPPTTSANEGAVRPFFGNVTDQDLGFLRSHGLTVREVKDSGPIQHLPFTGHTPAGLPIRVPRRPQPPPRTTRPAPN